MKKIKEYIAHFRWVIASQRFKKERFKKGLFEIFELCNPGVSTFTAQGHGTKLIICNNFQLNRTAYIASWKIN